jgi:hypothetical protein
MCEVAYEFIKNFNEEKGGEYKTWDLINSHAFFEDIVKSDREFRIQKDGITVDIGVNMSLIEQEMARRMGI